MQSETLYLILVSTMIIISAWSIISAYNKRVNEIKELREDVEKLKKKDEDAGDSS